MKITILKDYIKHLKWILIRLFRPDIIEGIRKDTFDSCNDHLKGIYFKTYIYKRYVYYFF